MKIENKYVTNCSFKKGLTKSFIENVARTNPLEVEKDLLKKGVFCDTKGIKSVAASFKKVVEIMEYNKFILPKYVLFDKLSEDVLGSYSPDVNAVIINSNIDEFYNIKDQNHLEESQKKFHPSTRNFLQTYLHEFIHAAHYNNLIKNNPQSEIDKIYKYLHETKTDEELLNPVSYFMKYDFKKKSDMYIDNLVDGFDDCFERSPDIFDNFYRQKKVEIAKWGLKALVDSLANKIYNYIYPNEIGNYAKTNLMEYLAEMISWKISSNINDSIDDIKQTIPPITFKTHPDNWNIFNRTLSNIKNVIHRKDTIFNALEKINIDLISRYKYLNGDIWYGNIKALQEDSYTKYQSIKDYL